MRRGHKKRDGWSKTRPGEWVHVSGWCVRHCGHPTALWPYYGIPAGGGPMELSPSGYAFSTLNEAQEAMEERAGQHVEV